MTTAGQSGAVTTHTNAESRRRVVADDSNQDAPVAQMTFWAASGDLCDLVASLVPTNNAARTSTSGAVPYYSKRLFNSMLDRLRRLETLGQRCTPELRQATKNAREWTDALVDHCYELIMRTHYADVSVSIRTLFMLASISHAAACSIGVCFHGQSIRTESTNALSQDCAKCQCQSLHALDRGLIVSGAPILTQQVHRWIMFLQSRLLSLDPLSQDSDHVCSDKVESKTGADLAHEFGITLSADRLVPVMNDPPSLVWFRNHMCTNRDGTTSKVKADRHIVSDQVQNRTPIIIRGVVDTWPCYAPTSPRSWSDLKSLCKRIGPHRLVPVELGSSYTSDDWSQQLITVQDLFKHIEASGSTSSRAMYLAQHDLVSQIPHLRDDIEIPDYCYTNTNDDDEANVTINVWIGPSNTVSPLHTDHRDNLFAQIHGYKYVRLYSPSQTSRLYPISDGDSHHMMSNTSQADVGVMHRCKLDPEAKQEMVEKYPLLVDAEYVECVVGPGDLLVIPSGWWHYVRSLSPSVSISNWF